MSTWSATFRLRFSRRRSGFVGATVRTNADGSVTLTLVREGAVLATATDRGIGCAPIVAPGKVGIRGDNDDFTVDDFTVTGA